MRLSECGTLKIVYENETYALAHLKCRIPENIFTTDLHCIRKERQEGKLMSFGYPWMSCGKDLKHYQMKVAICKKEIADHDLFIELNSKDKTKWGHNQIEFEEITKVLYLEYISFIENLT